jgi:iron complex transport system permease protein
MPSILIGYSARMGRMRAGHLVVLLVAASIAAIGASLALGSSGLDAPWQRLVDGDPLMRTIVWELRLPRALAAFGTGVVLSLAGVLMQALLRNPLADP